MEIHNSTRIHHFGWISVDMLWVNSSEHFWWIFENTFLIVMNFEKKNPQEFTVHKKCLSCIWVSRSPAIMRRRWHIFLLAMFNKLQYICEFFTHITGVERAPVIGMIDLCWESWLCTKLCTRLILHHFVWLCFQREVSQTKLSNANKVLY